jgi:hypothetical protein
VPNTGDFRTPLNRPITDREAALILWLLKHGEAGAERYIPQIDRLVVVSKCTCGCPTIDLALENEPCTSTRHGLISDHVAIVEGHYVGVMLFATEKQLCMLEAYALPFADEPFEFPEIDALFPWKELRNHPIPPDSDRPRA